MRYEAGHKDRTRELLLSEAAVMIRAGGPDGLSVATLMKRLGMTHGGFYVHFKSKDDLVDQAIDYMFKRRGVFMDSLDRDDPRSALGRLVDSYVAPKLVEADEDACPIPLLAGEHHRLPEAARQRFALGVERLTSTLVELLTRAELDASANTIDSAVAEMIGAASLARVKANDADARALLSAARQSIRAKLGLDPHPRLI